ncbi:MAG TPA: hypothetical protein VIL26_04435 [Clostridia bacterium]
MGILNDKFIDRLELYQIINKIFFDYIPDDVKIKALAHASEVIAFEMKQEGEHARNN